ncbi:MAG: class I SAM-dependent methyltransferase, partial [Anaerolineales bacterium]|nr:class I SAM-dependent methyltransferase [Anaerolineales bacterium]
MTEISRVTRTKEDARRTYDAISRWYDLFTGSEKKFTDLGLNMLNARSGEHILEIGFGTGYALLKLAQAARPAAIFGIDISGKMHRVAQRKLQRTGLSAQLLLGDAASLPYSDRRF